MSITVKAIKCPRCGETIYSRCHYDFHYCHCGAIAIDGGFDYVKISGKDAGKLQAFDVELDDVDEEGLHKDWSEKIDKYGWIPNAESGKEEERLIQNRKNRDNPDALLKPVYSAKERQEALERLQRAGIVDENGELTEWYGDDNADKGTNTDNEPEPTALACSDFPTREEIEELDRIGLRGVMDKIDSEDAPTNFDKWASEITPQSLTDQNGMPFFDCEICPACIPMKCDCRDPEKCKKNWAEWCARRAE